MIPKRFQPFALLLILVLFLSACGPQSIDENTAALPTQTQSPDKASSAQVPGSPASPIQTLPPTAVPTSTPQPDNIPSRSGPQIADFAPGISPLTGLPVSDPSLLSLPAVMISIPNFPVDARPQAGLSFAPWIFDIYIGEGMSRFLATFYGEEPQVEQPLHGTCQVRTDPFVPGSIVLGKRVWLDSNKNGTRDPGEPGIGGICVTLYDHAGNAFQNSSSDSNGYFGFNVQAGQEYAIGFEKPAGLDFTALNVGFANLDSNVDPLTGKTTLINPLASELDWDAGYVQTETPVEPTASLGAGTAVPPPANIVSLPPAEIGPIRSMRLPYGKIGKFFQGGCIVSASGDPSVLAQVPGCKYVYGDETSVNHALLDITEIRTLAEHNLTSSPVNYSGNLFDPAPPSGGMPASSLNVLWNWQDQSQFRYDPISEKYLRFANTPDAPLEFSPQTDRLTGQQLQFDNVIVMYVEHIAYAETKIDINLSIGNMGRSDLFRNGQVYHIYWSTVAQKYEQDTMLARPIRFTDIHGNPFPLAPGHTWVHVFTPASPVYEKVPGSGLWTGEFHAPLVK